MVLRCDYNEAAPIAEPRGNVWVTKAKGSKRQAVWSPHALREFCELTLRKLDAWEAEQSGRVSPIKPKLKPKRKVKPPDHR
jgi:hypothetical protein